MYSVSLYCNKWFLQPYKFLKTKTSSLFPYEKSIIQKIMEYIKDNMECIDGYFPYREKNVN